MLKKYTYIRGERKAERQIDQYLQGVNYSASSSSVLGELKSLWAVE